MTRKVTGSVGFYAVKHLRHQSRQNQGAYDSNSDADTRHPDSIPHHQAQYIGAIGP